MKSYLIEQNGLSICSKTVQRVGVSVKFSIHRELIDNADSICPETEQIPYTMAACLTAAVSAKRLNIGKITTYMLEPYVGGQDLIL